MTRYKKAKYPALMLFSLCMSLDAFGSSTVVLTSLEEERGDLKSKKARVVGPSIPSIITLADIQSILECKSRVLGQVLPEARKNLASIERSLLEKIRDISRETDFKRISELAGLVSSIKGLDGSSHNIFVMATQECTDDDALAMAGVAVAASGALQEEFSQLIALLATSEDTRDIDYRVLEEATKAMRDITKDIYNASVLSE